MKKILVIERKDDFFHIHKKELESEGYRTSGAFSEDEALSYLNAHNDPDLIVLDVGLENADGLGLLHKIRAMKRDIPIIINTDYSHYKSNFQTWLADDYLLKSWDSGILMKRIKDFLEPSAPPAG
jgi:DNA-binding response OmpR family regulator